MKGLDSGMSYRCMTFRIEGRCYAVDMENVHEIIDAAWLTRIPGTPDFMAGMVRLKGNGVPVVDIRGKFGHEFVDRIRPERIVVLEMIRSSGNPLLGILADSTGEVIELEQDRIEAPTGADAFPERKFIRGIFNGKDDEIVILDIDQILSPDELSTVDLLTLATMALGVA